MSLTDGSKSVAIPRVASPFTLNSFPSYATTPASLASVYYVRDGAVIADNGVAVGGPSGLPAAGIASIAVAQRSGAMLLAATTTTAAKPDSQQLSVGPLTGALAAVAGASGPLTRPAWAPGLNEVWIGSGANLLRIPSIGTAASTVTYASPSGTVFAIRSVAFSPDGVRIALILAQSDNNAQLFIGSVVRTDDGASIENLEQITPSALRLTDVAWNDANTLYAIGADTTRPGSFGIWSVEVDGSLLSPRTTANLPGAPDTITASQGVLPWVSADKAVWVQRGPDGTWSAPSGPGQTVLGSVPTYTQ